MYTYTYYGRIHPKRVNFNVKNVPEISIEIPGLNLSGIVKIKINNSNIIVKFVTHTNLLNHTENDVLASLKNSFYEMVELYVNIFCYLNSYNYSLEIYRVKCKKLNIDIIFNVQLETDLQIDGNKVTERLSEITNIILNDRSLSFLEHSFSDFVKGIRYPKETGFYFHRAIQTINKHAFDSDWDKMRKTLNLSENDTKETNSYRKKIAHGEYPPISGNQRVGFAKNVRKTIDSFITYLKNNR